MASISSPRANDARGPETFYILLLGGSMTFGLFIIGWYPIAFGLGWWSAATAIMAGSAVGAVFLGLSGLMGPHSGTNNPVSSGAYFGVAGRLIGSILEGTASLAFAAISIWTGGDALASALIRFFDMPDNEVVRLIAYAGAEHHRHRHLRLRTPQHDGLAEVHPADGRAVHDRRIVRLQPRFRVRRTPEPDTTRSVRT